LTVGRSIPRTPVALDLLVRQMRRTRFITIFAALLLGGLVAWLWAFGVERSRMLEAIAHDDETARRQAWTWLLAEPADGEPLRAVDLRKRINDTLAGAGDEALLHASIELRLAGLWGWEHQDRALLFRELEVRAEANDESSMLPAIDLLATCPLDLPPGDLMPIVKSLVRSPSPSVRRGVFEAACGWSGRERTVFLAELPIPEDDLWLRRMQQLVLSWDPRGEFTGDVDAALPIGILEAALLRTTMADPEDASPVLQLLRNGDREPRPAFEYILRYSDDPRALDELSWMEDAGNAVASFALQARSPEVDGRQARRVVSDRNAPLAARQLAAWRVNEPDRPMLEDLLVLHPDHEHPDVYAIVMLAEKHLNATDAAALAEQWIRSFDDNLKRAGALLAAMTGSCRELLRDAYELEDVVDVRATQRLALWAFGESLGDEDPMEFAHRVLHREDDVIRPDAVLAMLLAGRAEAIAYLTSRPSLESTDAVQWRAWMIERLLPDWHDETGRPIGGDRRAIRLHFDRLDALRLLLSRRLRFASENKTYTVISSSAGFGTS
jgi:hypothetical protein